MILFPCKFGDEYRVEYRTAGDCGLKWKNAVVVGIKITPAGTEVTMLVPPGEAVDAPVKTDA